MADCVYCSASLPDGPPWAPGPGRRLAFDPHRGRLWTICPSCTRWNLTPMEHRWETLEACEEAVVTRGRLRLKTEHLQLVEVGAGELIRVGTAPRVEYVDWRYGPRARPPAKKPGFWRRVLSRLPAAPVEGYDPYSTVLGRMPVPAWTASPFLESASVLTYLFTQVPLAPQCPSCRGPLALRPWNFQALSLLDSGTGLELLAPCGLCGDEVVVGLSQARASLRLGMSLVTPPPVMQRTAEPGGRVIEAAGGVGGFLQGLASARLSLGEMGPEPRAALLISLDELADGEALEAEWREAEEIASIVDGELTPLPEFGAFRKRILGEEE